MLSVVTIAKNEQDMIADCIKSVSFADEVIVVDSGSTDKTIEISRHLGANIVHTTGSDFSHFRNTGLKHALGDWLLYVDADERVTHELADEIKEIIKKTDKSAFRIPRKSLFLGKYMSYGGWGNDYVIRLFKKNDLQKYIHPLHEQPVFTGNLGTLSHFFIHISHRDLESMVKKTLFYTRSEAELRFIKHHPPVVWWRLIRVILTEFYLRFIKLQAYKDGAEGIIDGIFQVYNTFIIYIRLWELQHPQK